MLPERLDFLSRFEEFYMLLSTQCKAKSKNPSLSKKGLVIALNINFKGSNIVFVRGQV